MRTRSCTVALAGLLVSFSIVAVTSPALAAPKKKKSEPAAEPAPEPKKEKDVDDMMGEAATGKSASSSSSGSSSGSAAEEPAGEPDAWERPPADEEKPKAAPPPKVEEKYGDGRRIEIGLALGYGFKASDADWSPKPLNPYFFGAALRGGYELDMKVFLGAGFVYHLGQTKDLETSNGAAGAAGVISSHQNYMLAYLEGGYDIWAGDLIIRPSMWLGMGFAIVDPYLTTGGVHTVTDFMFAPGLNFLYTMDGIYIGGDVRYVAVTADGVSGLDLFGVIGLRFK